MTDCHVNENIRKIRNTQKTIHEASTQDENKINNTQLLEIICHT